MRSRLKWIAFALPLIGTGLIGAAHMPFARPLLSLIAATAGCPVSLNGSDPATLEAFRTRMVRARAGKQHAEDRPGLGFELGVATRPAVLARLEAQDATCEAQSSGAVLRCRWSKGDERIEAHLQFDAAQRLVAADAWHPARSAQAAVAALKELSSSLDARVGPPTSTRGELSHEHLAAQPLSRIAREYRYADYLARISVTNLGKHGIRVREQYQWIPEQS